VFIRTLAVIAIAVAIPTLAAAQAVPGHSPTSGAARSTQPDRKSNDPDAVGAPVQAMPAARDERPSPSPAAQARPPQQRWHEPVEIAFSIGVLAFGAALIVLFTRTLLKLGRDWRNIYLRLVVLTVVVTAGLFALTAGYTEQQISPMMGLLGTLVGYLLGREANAPQASDTPPPAK
jgi:hypothetical protein